jgi:pyruvate-formate lyase
MKSKIKINENILQQIDNSVLDEKRIRWKAAVKAAPYKLHVDRQKYATESWKQTEGEDIEIRRAMLFQHIVENIELSILDFDYIVGRMGPTVIGAYTAIDTCGDYLDGIWNDDRKVRFSMNDSSQLTQNELEVLREAARTFGGKTPADMGNKAWLDILGTWPQDILDARLKDPPLNTGNFGNSTNTIDFEKILNKGLKHIIAEAQNHIDEFVQNMGQDPHKFYFWKAVIIVCEACIALSHRYAALSRKLAESEPDMKRKAELLNIASICGYVPENPARNLHEALQSMSIVGICKAIEHPMHNHPQWGRGDQYLYPFFIKDVNSGVITVGQSMNMLAELIGRWGTTIYVDTGTHRETHQITFAINSINVGGITKDGEEGSNELSYMFLHAIGLLKQSSPTLGIRWNHDTPRWLMKKAIQTNIQIGGGIPLFENEEGIIKLFVEDGVPLEEARDWVGRGCVWPALPQRAEYKCGAAGFNNAAILHLALHNGMAITGKKLGLETGDPRNFTCFEQLWNAYAAQHRFIMHRTLWLANLARDVQAAYLRLPFLSAVSLQCCLDEGHDTMVPSPISEFGITDRAVIDTADSLYAVKKLVFDDKKLTIQQLMDTIDSNFEGDRGAEIQKMCLNAPKFGNDIDEVDEMARRVSTISAGSITSWNNSPYPRFKSLREGLSWHYAAGLGVGALPNGRKALEPLNDGSASPMRGMDRNGPTAVLRSVLKANFGDHSYVQALNQKFPKSMLKTDDSVEKLVDYTNAFLGAGGTHIQYNLVDGKELKAARIAPQEHNDLIVRVGGFSAYFIQLSPQIQDDIILRSEHSL